MKTKIGNFFMDSAKVITSPDELFYVKNQEKNYDGIKTSIFFTVFLCLILGIFTKDIIITLALIVTGVFAVLITNFIHAVISSLLTFLLRGNGSIMKLFNLISYGSVLDILIIIALSLFVFMPIIIIPTIILVSLWKMIIVTLAVNSEYEIGYGKSFLAAYGIILIFLIIVMGVL